MADSLALSLQSTTFNQPRAYLSGIPDEEVTKLQSRLPNLVDVRADAEKARELLKQPPPTDAHGVDQDGEYLGIMHPAIAYHIMLPSLTMFSYFCRDKDVPDDVQDLCLWALKQRLLALKEGSDKQLRRMLASPGPAGEVHPSAKIYMICQTLSKITSHLLSARINLPREAIPYAEEGMKLEEEFYPEKKDPFLRNPQSYAGFGVVLARAKLRDAEAKAILKRVMNDIDKISPGGAQATFIQSKLYLARVLRRMGDLEEAKKQETYLIKWFKKNSSNLEDVDLREWFLTEGGHDPVFEGLGGMKWLQNRKITWKAMDRSARACYNCGVREGPTKKMLRCGKCQYIYYCSKECQVKNYPFHKVSCLEHAEASKRAQLVKSISSEVGKCLEDWNKYRTYDYDQRASVHALGLKHNSSRGLTHIVIKSIKYVPNGGKDIVDRFMVVSAGVFAINDVLTEMDSLLNYHPGEARQAVNELTEEFNQGMGRDGTKVAFFSLLISDDKSLSTYLSRGGVAKKALAETNYNPNWRSLLNLGRSVVVKPLVLRCRAKDAEFDYVLPQTSNSASASGIIDDSTDPSSSSGSATTTTPRASEAVATALPGLRGMFSKK
ncbi:hypothetical protein E1B28_000100 [Marasmius oreades]|uniref:MYND-type domain-containing protein n=1 Tax=Marasmius oreades TaxID=181124 RepID=A0A9P8ADZ7_9AGAR|nr:uncharacterized protein E1B28_000100 [Marasmius oreades]KAG7098129.1 hypothetical protein E1B28_000100 [Marasmius oreades]